MGPPEAETSHHVGLVWTTGRSLPASRRAATSKAPENISEDEKRRQLMVVERHLEAAATIRRCHGTYGTIPGFPRRSRAETITKM